MKKVSQAFDEIEVTSAKVTENGEISVNLPNKVDESEVKETLMSNFSGYLWLDEVKKTRTQI